MVPQPKPPCTQGSFQIVLALLVSSSLSLLAASPARAQTGPRILHQGLNCVLSGEHLILEALIEPADGLTTVKAYFRADLYSQFYYIEMVPADDVYRGILPKPSPDIRGLHYYLEAMDSSFNSVRTAEYTPEVVSDETNCRQRNPTPAAYLDGTGAISVGSTGGGPALPSGFLTEGIAGTIPAVGRATGGGSGILIGTAAAAGAAAGVGILVTQGSNEPSTTTTTTSGGAATTSAATTTVSAATTTTPIGGVMACFETSPNPPRIPIGGSIRFDASCTEPARDQIRTYVWNFNDGRSEREGRVVNRVYPQPGTYGTLLTVTTLSGELDTFEMNVIVDENTSGGGGSGGGGGGPTTTVPGDADLSLTAFGPPGGVSSGVNVSYTVNYASAGPDFDPSVSINTTFNASSSGTTTFVSGAGCGAIGSPSALTVNCNIGGLASGGGGARTITVRFNSSDTYFLTATITGGTQDPNFSNNTRSLNIPAALKAPPGAPHRTRLTSYIDLPPGDGSMLGRVTFNELRTATTDNSGPSTHEVPGKSGENLVEALLTSNPQSTGVWRFDFRGAPGFVAGSFVVDEGQLVMRQSHEIAFRVAPGIRRVRFRYRLE